MLSGQQRPDESVEYLIKIYTFLSKEEIESILAEHRKAPEKRVAQKALARGVTEVVHGKKAADAVEALTEKLFDSKTDFKEFSEDEIIEFAEYLPTTKKGAKLIDILVENGLAYSKKKAREFMSAGAITVNGEKVSEDTEISQTAIVKKGKNKFVIVK